MRKEQQLALATARRCQTVAARHLGNLPHDQVPARALLHAMIVQIDRLAAEQQEIIVGARTERTRQEVLTSVLRSKHLHPLVRALRERRLALAGRRLLDHDPSSGAALVMAARCVAVYAEEQQAELIAAGLTPTFHVDLLSVAQALEECMSTRLRLRTRATELRQAVDEQLHRVGYALDAIESALRIRYATKPGVIAEWREARKKTQTPKAPDTRTPARGLISVR